VGLPGPQWLVRRGGVAPRRSAPEPVTTAAESALGADVTREHAAGWLRPTVHARLQQTLPTQALALRQLAPRAPELNLARQMAHLFPTFAVVCAPPIALIVPRPESTPLDFGGIKPVSKPLRGPGVSPGQYHSTVMAT
jgi:hypothetical protein